MWAATEVGLLAPGPFGAGICFYLIPEPQVYAPCPPLAKLPEVKAYRVLLAGQTSPKGKPGKGARPPTPSEPGTWSS